MDSVWSDRHGWTELRQGGEITLIADETARARIARFLEVDAITMLSATLSHKAWMDGVEIEGRILADATRLCGVSLEAFNEHIDTPLNLRLVPEGSANAPERVSEIVVEIESDDPPEVVSGNTVDLSNYVVETLSLTLDPFPRKGGVAFEYTDTSPAISPFTILRSLKPTS